MATWCKIMHWGALELFFLIKKNFLLKFQKKELELYRTLGGFIDRLIYGFTWDIFLVKVYEFLLILLKNTMFFTRVTSPRLWNTSLKSIFSKLSSRNRLIANFSPGIILLSNEEGSELVILVDFFDCLDCLDLFVESAL